MSDIQQSKPPDKLWIDGFLAQEPPPVLYHYTDETGLHGMFTRGEIWATNFRFFNDATEFEHGRELARNEIDGALSREADSVRIELLKTMRKAVDAAGINIYVSSWSELSDDLSQWRAYGGSRTGYEIGMSGAELTAIGLENDFVLVRCLYDEEEKRHKMRQLIQQVLDENSEPKTEAEIEEVETGGNLAYYLNRCACMFKDTAFKSEKEWRLVSRPKSLRRERADVRPRGRSTLVSFYRMQARSETTGAVQICSLRVGPCPHPELALQAVKALLLIHNKRVGHSGVSKTQIPYRNW